MDAKPFTIRGFFKENKQYVAPVYQRNYAWMADQQCQALWSDLLSLSTKVKAKHFLGSVVIIQLDDSLGRNFVIDGQQRLTTIQLLLIAMRDYVLERKAADTSGESQWVQRGDGVVSAIKDMILTNANECKLELNGDDKDVFSNLVREVPHDIFTPQEQCTNVFLNYHFFLERLRQGFSSSAASDGVSFEQLSALWKSLNSGMEIACIVLSERDNPQRVFESLNSTGLDLQASDLIRNYVLMSSDGNDKQQKELFDKYWHPFEQLFPVNDSTHLTNFFLNLVTLKQLLIGRKELNKNGELYQTFKEFYCNDPQQGALVYAPELLHYGVCYARMMGWQTEENPKLAALFADMFWLKGSVRNPFYAVMLYLYYCYRYPQGQASLQLDELLQFGHQIVSFMVRRAVVSRESRDLTKLRDALFIDLAVAPNLAEQVKVNFSLTVLNDTFPKDAEFELALKGVDIYNTNTTLHLCRFLLTRLAQLDVFNPSDLAKMTIEHILPQNKDLKKPWQQELGSNWPEVQELWLHRLGNLTLTFENSELGDRPFADKLDFYRKSNIRYLNDSVVNNEHWTSVEMESRNRVLAQRCLELWPMPETVDLEELSKHKRSARGGKRKQVNLADFCGTSQSLLGCLKELDNQVQSHLKEQLGFQRFLKLDFDLIEYCAYSHTLAVLQPDKDSETIKLWLHCYYDNLPDEVKDMVNISSDWVSWQGDEVLMEFNTDADIKDLMASYFTLGKALDAIKHQIRAGLI